jgi:membrane protease YdiL (CAAX protease family)
VPSNDRRTILGFIGLYLVLELSARSLKSFRGEFGLVVCALVLTAGIAVELVSSPSTSRRVAPALRALGFGAPRGAAFLGSLIVAAALLGLMMLYAASTGMSIQLRSDAFMLAIGMFAQGGIAEEVVFRGFLFRRLCITRTFWRTACLAAVPFMIVHAAMFATLDFYVALSSLLLALSISFPLAWLFERAGNSIWPPAIVHAIIQGAIKVVDAPADQFASLALFWIAAGATVPWLFFVLRPVAKS